MPASMHPLREEHRGLRPRIDQLRWAADHVGADPRSVTKATVDHAYGFLVHELLPHARAEDRALYPVVARLMGSPDATRTMSRDHLEVERLTVELGELARRVGVDEGMTAETARELRRVLYGLYAVVALHFAKEEEVYVPLLEASLSEREATAMFAAMHDAAHEAHVAQEALEHGLV